MRCVIEDESVDALIFLGIGIQSNQAKMMRDGDRYPNFELDRIVKYHEGQDVMYAQVAAQLSAETRKPILVATELAVADPNNPGVKAVRESGRLCYASGQRAARALSNVYRYAKWQGLAK
jgi:acetyltransferase